MDAKQWALIIFSFVLSGPCILITTVPLNNLIIITIIIVIKPYFYLLLFYKPIRNILLGERVSPHKIITHFLYFKVIRDIVQLPWVYLNYFNRHLLSFKTVRNIKKCCRVDAHYLIAYLPVLRWSGTNLTVYGLRFNALSYISFVLKRSGTYSKECGSMRTA